LRLSKNSKAFRARIFPNGYSFQSCIFDSFISKLKLNNYQTCAECISLFLAKVKAISRQYSLADLYDMIFGTGILAIIKLGDSHLLSFK